MRTDFYNEAIVTAMLVASASGESTAMQTGTDNAMLTGADVLREHLSQLMDRGGKTAVQAGMPNTLIEAADFAASAFIDEILLSSPLWKDKGEWLKKPLQFSRHGTATAGEDFFRVLDGLLEEAEKTTPVETNPINDLGQSPSPELEGSAFSSPLHATLEIYALCLAQGFTGMFYGNPAAIQAKLANIGRFVPAVRQREEPFFMPPAPQTERGPKRRVADTFRRFDPLDWLLWLIPPVVTFLVYRMLEVRLDLLLQPFLQGSALS
ncbi:DotU family type IV/VI secretion system protein [Desulfovibrio sp. OttesenSCG-928-M14]|nr:DotU family type IV/VI secretion system protein [Desulfovibrio sp. OttesenSCG-928-M14]